jgi:hypothetical protein
MGQEWHNTNRSVALGVLPTDGHDSAKGGHRDPPTKTKSLGIVRGFEFRRKFSTPLVQYLCTLPMRGGFTGAATP